MAREPELRRVAAPMHDEEDTATAFHARVAAALEGVDFELVIADDGSRDGTGAVLAAPRRSRTSASRSSRSRATSATRRRSPPRSSTPAATWW